MASAKCWKHIIAPGRCAPLFPLRVLLLRLWSCFFPKSTWGFIAPFLSCLVCDITFLARIFRKIRVKNVISQARQDKKGSIMDVSSGSNVCGTFLRNPETDEISLVLGTLEQPTADELIKGGVQPFY